MVRREELFTLEELTRASRRLKANTAPGIDGAPNEILKEVIVAYPEIFLEVFNSCLREGRIFVDWKKQRLVLLRKSNKPLEDASPYRPICIQRLQTLLVGENDLSREGVFGSNRYA